MCDDKLLRLHNGHMAAIYTQLLPRGDLLLTWPLQCLPRQHFPMFIPVMSQLLPDLASAF